MEQLQAPPPVVSLRTENGFPLFVRQDYPGPNGDPDMSVELAVREGRPEVVALTFTTKEDGRGLRSADLARVNIDRLVHDIYKRTTGGLLPHLPVDAPHRAERARRARPTGRPTKVTTALLTEVARIYSANADHHPVKAVGAHFGVEQRQASHYVRLARDAELLPESSRSARKTTRKKRGRANG